MVTDESQDDSGISAEGSPVDQFANHAERMAWVVGDASRRRAEIAGELRAAFRRYIESRPTDWIRFDRVTAADLAAAFLAHPKVIKPVTAICNIATRAVQRDLGFALTNPYNPKLTREQADQLAGYVKPFLPRTIALPAIESVDDWFFIDKEIRSHQGRWESLITDSISKWTNKTFRKRKFTIEDESGQQVAFELDAAYPAKGEPIQVGIDVKRIGSPRDIHKRIDEIVNKAVKFKKKYPRGMFGSVIYYPFDSVNQANIMYRMRSADIDAVVFPAGDSPQAVLEAVLMMIPQVGLEMVEYVEPDTLFESIEHASSDSDSSTP